MAGRFRRNARLIWNIAAAVIIAGACAITVLRALLPGVGRDRAMVADWVSQVVGAPIEIGAIDATVIGGFPTVTAHGIRIFSNDLNPIEVLRFEHAQARIAVWASVLAGRLELTDLTLSGLALTIVRQTGGRLVVKGFADRDSAFVSWLSSQPNLFLNDAELTYVDERTPLPPIRALAVSLRFDSAADKILIRGRASHVDLVAAGLDFELRIEGDPAAPSVLDVNLAGAQLDLVTVAERLALKHPDLKSFRADAHLQMRAELPGPARLLFAIDNIEMTGSAPALPLRGLRGQATMGEHTIDLNITQTQTGQITSKVDWRASIARGDRPQLRMMADQLPVDVIPWLSSWLPHDVDTLGAAVSNWGSRGELRDLRIGVRSPLLYIAGTLTDLQIKSQSPPLRIKGLTAQFAGNTHGGALALNNAAFTIANPLTFAEPVRIAALNGTMQWAHRPTSASVLQTTVSGFVNALPVTLLGGATWPGEAQDATLDVSLKIGTGDVTQLPALLPLGLMHAHGDHWFRTAFEAGTIKTASIVLKGPWRAFPFDADQGAFNAELGVEDVHLHYAPNWPDATALAGDLRIQGRRLNGTLSAANFLNSPLRAADFAMADIFSHDPLLTVTGTIRASLDDALKTLRASPLKGSAVRQLDDLEVSGQFDLDLDLRLGLREGAKRTALGSVRFDGNRLRSKQHQVELDDLRGRLSFTRDDWYGEALTASIGDQRIGLVATGGVGDPNYDTELRITGTTGADDIKSVIERFAPSLHRWLLTHDKLQHIKGAAPWKSVLTIPQADNDAPTATHLVIESSLNGLSVELPWPFGKSAEEDLPFKLDGLVENSGMRWSTMALGDDLRISIGYDGPTSKIAQIDAAFGPDTIPKLQYPGAFLHGNIDTFALNEWAQLLRSEAALNALPLGFDLAIAKFNSLGQVFKNVKLLGRQDDDAWRVQIESARAAGEILFPRRKTAPVTLNFERLWLDRLTASDQTKHPLDPRALPELVVACASFKYRDIDFGQVSFATARAATGLEIKSLAFSNPAFQVQSTGEWTMNDDDQRSRFSIELTGNELGSVLQRFGYDAQAINGGHTEIELEATWPGMPSDFTLASLDGKLNLRVAKGRFLDIEPGSGRLFGLLSLQTLPRRLSLDFADLFQKGFAFDRIEGWFELESGNAYTNSLLMEGPSAKVEISGRTGIALKDYDQRAIVTPALSKSIPLASALFGPAGIGVGAAIYLSQKVFKDIPDQVDRVLRKNYSITGSWDNPIVTRL